MKKRNLLLVAFASLLFMNSTMTLSSVIAEDDEKSELQEKEEKDETQEEHLDIEKLTEGLKLSEDDYTVEPKEDGIATAYYIASSPGSVTGTVNFILKDLEGNIVDDSISLQIEEKYKELFEVDTIDKVDSEIYAFSVVFKDNETLKVSSKDWDNKEDRQMYLLLLDIPLDREISFTFLDMFARKTMFKDKIEFKTLEELLQSINPDVDLSNVASVDIFLDHSKTFDDPE